MTQRGDRFLIIEDGEEQINPLIGGDYNKLSPGNGYKLRIMWKRLTAPNDSINNNDAKYYENDDLIRSKKWDIGCGYKVILFICIICILALCCLIIILLTKDLVLTNN